MVEKITRIPLKDVFKNETDFTVWLEKNLDVLNNCLDVTLSNAEREKTVGDLRSDLVAEDDAGKKVIIENQFGKSDHDHLGKLITYLAMEEAQTAIWIVSDHRPEHVEAITWLNKSMSESFYLLKVEAIKIGDSAPAPLLTLIVWPSEIREAVRKSNEEFSERHYNRLNFWKQFLEYAKTKTPLHANISPGKDNWLGTGAGRAGLMFTYLIYEHESAAELYINRGTSEENKAIFYNLYEHKADIEAKFGEPLEWERLDSRKACRIRKTLGIGGRLDESKWQEINVATVDAMIRLEKVLKPYIQEII